MLAIAELTIKKMRQVAFFLLFLFAILIGYCVADMDTIATQITGESILSHLINEKSVNQPVLTSTFCAFFVSLLFACFSGAAEIPREISSGQIQLLLTKPLSRTAYMFGKYLGILVICLVFFTATEITVFLTQYFSMGETYSFSLIFRQFQLTLAYLPFVAIIVALSCFVGDIAAIIITVVYILFSMLFNMIPIIIAMLPRGVAGEVENYIYVLYYFFPNFIFYFIDYRVWGLVSVSLLIYSLSIAGLFLLIASYRLNHMDFSKKD
jgi:ABC-type transport system involved in multi-copper enzyme maturation permease subunit